MYEDEHTLYWKSAMNCPCEGNNPLAISRDFGNFPNRCRDTNGKVWQRKLN